MSTTQIYVMEDGETWTEGDIFLIDLTESEFADVVDGAKVRHLVEAKRFKSVGEMLGANVKLVTVAVNPELLKEQRDAVLYSIDDAELCRGQDGMPEHIDKLDGVMSMLDTMLDLSDDEA